MAKPLVAIVGRPNVGKSTLFNRLVGERMAIVEDLPGTTRDRLYAQAEWVGKPFVLVDTGGLVLDEADDMVTRIRKQAEQAIADADVIILLVDTVVGITSADHEIADLLRRTNKPVLLAANKADTAERLLIASEFYSLGLGEVYPISAIHSSGVADLLDALVASFPAEEVEEEPGPGVRIAIIGRPGVGKSSLVNALLGEERVIVSATPGTTRDAIDTMVRWHGQDILLIDTAGIRQRGKIAPGVEKYSVLRALKALERCNIVLLVIDAAAGLTAQDAHVAGYAIEANKSIVIVANKWDLVQKDSSTLEAYQAYLRQQLNFVPYAPIVFTSAVTHQRIEQVLEVAVRVYEQRQQRIPTGELNDIIQEATIRHSPPSKAGRRLKFYYATQPSVNPPTLVFFVNDAKLVHFSYQRYLENRIREKWGFEGTPLRLVFRGREEDDNRK